MTSAGARTPSPPGQATGIVEPGNRAGDAAVEPNAMPINGIETRASGRLVMAGIVHGPFGMAGLAAVVYDDHRYN
jgi:hypothetical protein